MSVVLLPQSKDPADLAREAPEQWRTAIRDRQDVFSFLLARARKRYPLGTPEGQREAAADLLPVVARARDPVLKGRYAQELASLLGVAPRFVADALAGERTEGAARGAASSQALVPAAGTGTAVRREERLLVLLLAQPAVISKVAAVLPPSALSAPHAKALYTELIAWYDRDRAERPAVGTLADLRSSLPEDLQKRFDTLLLVVETEREEDEWDPARETESVVQSLLLRHLRAELRAQTAELQSASSAELPERLRAIAAVTAQLSQADRVTLDGTPSP